MALTQTLASARALLLLQVGVRLVTFVLNQLLVRTTSPAVFGAANVQLELVLSIVLALARDGVRATVMRRRDQQSSVHNLALLPVVIGSVLAVSVGWGYVAYLAPDALRAQGSALPVSVALYCLGAMLELVSEPLHTYALTLEGYVRLRVAMEASAVLARAVCAVLLLRPQGLDWLASVYAACVGHAHTSWLAWALGKKALGPEAIALVAFSLSRAVFGGVLLLTACVGIAYMDSWRRVVTTLLPARGVPLDKETRELVVVTSGQALLKFVLTEGDKLAVARLTTLEDQGGYALASNYGSLLARTLFQPIEESARLYFSEALGSSKKDAAEAQGSAALLSVLFRLHALLGLGLLTFGPPLAQPFLMIVAGPRWAQSASGGASHASAILASYCYYLPVMGINGIVEAFLQSTAPPALLAWYSRVLVGSSAAFVGALALGHGAFAHYGAALESVGLRQETVLVWANIVGLAVRAVVCMRYVAQTLASAVPRPSLVGSLPAASILGTLGMSAATLRYLAAPLGERATWFAPNSALVPLATTMGLGVATTLLLWYVSLLTQCAPRAPLFPRRAAARAIM